MRLIFIRHGEPDYEKKSLTPKGFREAELLGPYIPELKGNYFYVSPQGRAKHTAETALKGTGIEPVELDFLHEFRGKMVRPHENELKNCWDWMPADWTREPLFFTHDRWGEAKGIEGTNIKAEYDRVTACFDELLKEHGYERDGYLYKAVRPNHDTLVFFCHYAITAVFLSHLLNISPWLIWAGTVAKCSSVTELATEERQEGIAYFRMNSFGDVTHLHDGGEDPSFWARFCECYTDETRH